ncbi:MAG: hypothetical protein PHY94_03600 [Candidatus Omnitrophica bacterium]|nr:hypothetical protein [Candidatus Omnitrophota bacterium]
MKRTLIALVILGLTSVWCFAQGTPVSGTVATETKDKDALKVTEHPQNTKGVKKEVGKPKKKKKLIHHNQQKEEKPVTKQ